MIEDELIKIWQSSSSQERIKFEKSKLMIELQSSLERLNRWWKFGVRVEVVAAFIATPIFAFLTYWIPNTNSKIASALIIIYVVFVITQLIGIKKHKPTDLEENYFEYLKKSKEYLKAQRKLLKTYIYWAALPLYPIIFLFVVDFWEIPSKRIIIIILFLNMLGLHIYGYFSTKKRVENEINPQVKRIDEVIESLKE